MANRYEGKADRLDRKHGKLRRQVDADIRKEEAVSGWPCGHTHTVKGAQRCEG